MPASGEDVVSPMQAWQINAFNGNQRDVSECRGVCLARGAAKSGVGGGVVAIVPHEMAIAVWSPELDETGNSLAGVAALEQLTKTPWTVRIY